RRSRCGSPSAWSAPRAAESRTRARRRAPTDAPHCRDRTVRASRSDRASRDSASGPPCACHTKGMGRSALLSIVASILLAGSAFADGPTTEDVNNSNNPLTPMLGLNIQDYYASSYYRLKDSDSNTGLGRVVLPHKLFDLPQIARLTVPVVTSPDEPAGSTTNF